jgi:hypothetical protein
MADAISAVSSSPVPPVQHVRRREGSKAEEAHESVAEKEREAARGNVGRLVDTHA